MRDVSNKTQDAVTTFVSRDLNPSHAVVFVKTGGSIFLGGLMSLFVCSQFGLSLSPFADKTVHLMHRIFGDVGCICACAVIFSIIPVITLRLVTTAIQFKIITTKHVYSWMLYFLSFGFILLINNGSYQYSSLVALWFVLVVVSFKALSILLLTSAWGSDNVYV